MEICIMAAAAAEKQASQGKESAAGDLSIQQEIIRISTPILTTESKPLKNGWISMPSDCGAARQGHPMRKTDAEC
jgi:hypothetical protein